jgi:type I restriction enzyme R subunit
MGLFDIFKKNKKAKDEKYKLGMHKTRENSFGSIKKILEAKKEIDDDLFDELEEVFIMADVGVDTVISFVDDLREEVGITDIDDFDLICHIAFDQKPLTRQERADKLKNKKYLDKYSGIAREVMTALLDKYATGGITNLENTEILNTQPFKQMGSPMKIAKEFGGKTQLQNALIDLQKEIYVD